MKKPVKVNQLGRRRFHKEDEETTDQEVKRATESTTLSLVKETIFLVLESFLVSV